MSQTTGSDRERRPEGRGERVIRRRPGFRLLTFAASALAVLLLVEGGARALHTALPEPIEWYDDITQVKVEQMDRYNQRGQDVDYVFAGTSMVFRGIAPHAFDRAAEPETFSYNAGLLAGMPPVMERWILEEVEPRLKPEKVVYGISSLDFQGRRYKFPVNAYEAAPATRKGFLAAAQRWGSRVLKLVHTRAMLREPKTWKKLREKEGKAGPVERKRERMEAKGHIYKNRKKLGDRERRRMQENVLGGFAISDRGTRNITRIVRTLERRGVEVVFVSMPVPQRFIDVHPSGEADFAAAEGHIERLADSLGVPFIDMSDSMRDEAFVDFTHLGREGAAAFSGKLRKELRRNGV